MFDLNARLLVGASLMHRPGVPPDPLLLIWGVIPLAPLPFATNTVAAIIVTVHCFRQTRKASQLNLALFIGIEDATG